MFGIKLHDLIVTTWSLGPRVLGTHRSRLGGPGAGGADLLRRRGSVPDLQARRHHHGRPGHQAFSAVLSNNLIVTFFIFKSSFAFAENGCGKLFSGMNRDKFATICHGFVANAWVYHGSDLPRVLASYSIVENRQKRHS